MYMKHFLTHKQTWGVLLVIVLAAFFLRSYHLGEWLHFELDQSRDAKVIDAALEGSYLDLPLLGPKAGGTFLRLAPGFYYLEYLSARIVSPTPVGMAWLVVIVSTLFVGVLYCFLRRGFSEKISLGLTALAAVSVYLVMYGRFAWNPNLIPLFALFGFYALLRSVDHEEHYRGRWFLAAAFGLTLATHFHFLAFLALPAIAGAFLLIKRPRFSLRVWIGVLLIVGVLYSPMVMNEIATQGTNTKEFFGAITEKSTKEDRNLVEKAVRNMSEFSLANSVILTGYEGATFPSVVLNEKEWGTVCDKRCDEGKWYGVAGLLFVLWGLWALLVGWWKAHTRAVSDFYLLSGLWLGVSLVLFLPLAFAIAPRFYLLSVPLSFVLLGSIFQQTSILHKQRHQAWFWVVIGCLIASNLFFLYGRFDELKRADTESVVSRPDRILKERVRVTYGQQETLAQYFKKRSEENGYPVYLTSEPQYKRSIKYLMEQKGIVMGSFSNENLYQEGLYYLVLRTEGNIETNYQKYLAKYELVGVKPFGTLSVVELRPRPEAVIGVREDFSVPSKKADSKAPPRYTWREFFSGEATTVDEEEESLNEDN